MRSRPIGNFGTQPATETTDVDSEFELVEVEDAKAQEPTKPIGLNPINNQVPNPSSLRRFLFTGITTNGRSELKFSGEFNKSVSGDVRIVRNPALASAGTVFLTRRHFKNGPTGPEQKLTKKEITELKTALENQIKALGKTSKAKVAEMKTIVKLLEAAINKPTGLNPINNQAPVPSRYSRFEFLGMSNNSRSKVTFYGQNSKSTGGEVTIMRNPTLPDAGTVYFQPTRMGKPSGEQVTMNAREIRAMRDSMQKQLDAQPKKKVELKTMISLLTAALEKNVTPPIQA